MRHRAAALLAFAEMFLDFMNLGALKTADLRSHLLQRGADQGQGGKIMRMTVALQNLGGNIRRMDAKLLTDIILHKRRNIGKRSDRTADLACFDICGSRIKPFEVPLHLFIPERKLQSEGRDLRMDAMGSSHHDGILVLQGIGFQDFHEIENILAQNGVCFLKADAICRIDDISARHAIMHPLLFLTETLGNTARERDDIMFRLCFNLMNAVHIKLCILPDRFHIFRRNLSEFAPGFINQDLDLQPCLIHCLFAPDITHHFPRIPFNHSSALL